MTDNEKIRTAQAAWNAANKDRINAAQRKHYAKMTPEQHAARAAYLKEWRKNHPDRTRLYNQTFRAKKKAAADALAESRNVIHIVDD